MCHIFLTKFEDDDENDDFEDDTAEDIINKFYIVADDDNDEGLILFESKYDKIFWTISPKSIHPNVCTLLLRSKRALKLPNFSQNYQSVQFSEMVEILSVCWFPN